MTEVCKGEQTLQRLLPLELMGSTIFTTSFMISMPGGLFIIMKAMGCAFQAIAANFCRGVHDQKHHKSDLHTKWTASAQNFIVQIQDFLFRRLESANLICMGSVLEAPRVWSRWLFLSRLSWGQRYISPRLIPQFTWFWYYEAHIQWFDYNPFLLTSLELFILAGIGYSPNWVGSRDGSSRGNYWRKP